MDTIKKESDRRKLKTIKVQKETADLIRVYCIFNKLKIKDYANDVFEKDPENFKEKLCDIKGIEAKN